MADSDLVDLNAAVVIATQMHQDGKPTVTNLSDRIIDVVIETSVGGASTLTLSIMDPDWKLMTSGFISISDDGFLAPIDVNYPTGTGQWWRLVACAPTSDIDQANLTLTFEDRGVNMLRDFAGPKSSTAGQSREAFIASCVRAVPWLQFISPTYQDEVSAGTAVGVGSTIATGTQIPASSSSPKLLTPGQIAKKLSAARRNPTKTPGLDTVSRKAINRALKKAADTVGAIGDITL